MCQNSNVAAHVMQKKHALDRFVQITGNTENDFKNVLQFLENALNNIPYIEGVSCLIDLYDEIDDIEKKIYWEKFLKKSKENNLHAPYAFLDFFDEYRWQSP